MKGAIYKVTSPSGKNYIGQTIYEIKNRWRDHCYDAFDINKDHCKLLNKAIRKYGKDAFILECLEYCDKCDLDNREEYYINKLNTLKPFGYNLKQGGSSSLHTEETKNKIKNSLINIPKSKDTKLKISNAKKEAIGSDIPHYVIHIRKNNEVIGYRIVGHPNQNKTEKRFASKLISLDEKLKLALNYLEYLNKLDKPLNKNIRTLPKYLQKYKHGYMVSIGNKNKYFLSKNKTNNELYDDALKYLNINLSATHLVQGIP